MVMKKINIEVAYAGLKKQRIFAFEIEAGSTIAAAIEASGVMQEFPEIDLSSQKIGVFSKSRKLTDIVQAGERIEIYRPLTIDPKEARRKRAIK